MDETVLMLYIPRLLIVEVPPTNSLGCNLPYLALLAKSLVRLEISMRPRVSAR